MEITYDVMTGLLYVDNVPFTKERVIRLKTLIGYGNDCHGQFEYSITVKDKINEGEVTIDKRIMRDIVNCIEHYEWSLASDKDFMN